MAIADGLKEGVPKEFMLAMGVPRIVWFLLVIDFVMFLILLFTNISYLLVYIGGFVLGFFTIAEIVKYLIRMGIV